MARQHANLILMGLRGSGKTTIGGLLAKRLRRSYVDLDDKTVVLLGGKSVAEAFRRAGEPAFRTAEVAALQTELGKTRQILALGGGTPAAPGAAALLRAKQDSGDALIVFLTASTEVLRERLAKTDTASRPSLTGKGTLEEIDQVRARREPMYQSLASLVVDSSNLSAEQAAIRIANWFEEATTKPDQGPGRPAGPPRKTPG